jgi:lysophospholipid acyltransferase (LPLAT)-like uncharacterized protein
VAGLIGTDAGVGKKPLKSAKSTNAIMEGKKTSNFSPRALLTNLGGHLTTGLVRTWMRTLDFRGILYDRSVDPARGLHGSRIYVFWHENILMPLYLRGHCNLTMLLSQHRDADLLAAVAHNFGFSCVRGSTYRGATRAILQLTNCSRQQHITLTPDGPRGPRRRMAQGPIYLASKLQLPLVVMGIGYDLPWRINSWDRFAVPRPFSRARAIVGPPIMLPKSLDRAGLEECRVRAERLLNCLTCEAEAWAVAGTPKAGELNLRPERAPTRMRANDIQSHARQAPRRRAA